MTSVGRRPTLDELREALYAIEEIEADQDALDPSKETFRVVLTFRRGSCPEDWRDGQPKPSWLIEQLREELAAWAGQRIKEEQWASKEDRFGAGIDSVIAYWSVELQRVSKGNGLSDRVAAKFIANTILRLQELKERREAGSVYSQTETRREKARKSWAEDEYEAPRREEEQRRQREQTNYTQQQAHADFSGPNAGVYDEMYRQYSANFKQRYEGHFYRMFEDAMYGRGAWSNVNPPPKTGNKRPWYEVLGVQAGATKADITKAYRRLAGKFHPDRYKEADGHAKMAEINTARDEGLGGL